ncbi:oligoribonuclease-like, partial [Trifolium medium]|nr:oligoribonuclease-like [Trifolium medium]
GPDLVIHQTKECLDMMGEWCQSHHAASGKWYVEYELSLASRYQHLLCIPPQELDIHVLIDAEGCSSFSDLLEVTLYHDILI